MFLSLCLYIYRVCMYVYVPIDGLNAWTDCVHDRYQESARHWAV